MADIVICGQSSANPAQPSNTGTIKPSRKAGVPFGLLLAIFQSGGLPGQIIPGPNGELRLACDISQMTDAELFGKCPGKQAPSDLILTIARPPMDSAQGKGEIPPETAGLPEIDAETAKTAAVNMIALLNSNGKSSADNVSANAIKPESPALLKAIAKQDGQATALAGGPDANAAVVKESGSDMAGFTKQGLNDARADLPGNIPPGQKTDDSFPLPADGVKPEKYGRENQHDRSKIAATKTADTEITSGLKSAAQGASMKDSESANKAVAPGAENFRFKFKENPGEKTAAAGMKTETAKAHQTESAGVSARPEHFESGAAGRPNNSPDYTGVRTAEIKADRDPAPRTEAVKNPGQAVSGTHVQGAAAGFSAAAGPNAEIGFPETLNGAMLEQVSEGTIELFRSGGGRVKLTLSPPELGSVEMDLIVDRTGMRLVLTSESGDVRSVLQANMDQLRSSLHDQGMNRFEILVQDRPGSDSGWQAGGHSGRESLQNGEGGGNGQLRDDGAPALSRPATDDGTRAISMSRENLNGALSLFA